MADKTKFITNDKSILKEGKLDETDKEIMNNVSTGKGFTKITSAEQLMNLAQSAVETKRYFDDMITDMTEGQALFVKKIRVEEKGTWRYVARKCHEEWGGDWEPPSNQLMGMALCERASKILGEEVD